MPDIHHDFPISAPAERVFAGVATPRGLDAWWTLRSSGQPELGAEYSLFFGPDYDWRGVVSECSPDSCIEWRLTSAMPDWVGTRVRFDLREEGAVTHVRFSHSGWADESAHYRTSSYCWAMYLRILKRHLEFGEVVPYELRLDV